DGIRVRLIVSLRADAAEPAFVAQCSPQRLALGPLSVAAMQRIVAERLEVALPRPALVRITEASRGNPFHALEIVRVLVERDLRSWTSPLPIPDDLRTLVDDRIASLPREAHAELLRASALSRPDASLLDLAALAPAEAAGLVAIDERGAVAFAHPLFASAVYGSASELDRRALHRELAAEVESSEDRARHLALAATGPDESAASLVQEAARTARARGA